jgi:predicted phosphatase
VKLYVFDFDNTLFKSPPTPKGWEGGPPKWWSSIVSITSPAVPEEPDNSWWVEEMIDKVKECVTANNGYVILLTGREENVFKQRVYQLLEQVDITKYFDFIGLNHLEDSRALESKLQHLDRFLQDHSGINEVEFWDDREVHVQHFKDWAAKQNLACIHNLVPIAEKQAEVVPLNLNNKEEQ